MIRDDIPSDIDTDYTDEDSEDYLDDIDELEFFSNGD